MVAAYMSFYSESTVSKRNIYFVMDNFASVFQTG